MVFTMVRSRQQAIEKEKKTRNVYLETNKTNEEAHKCSFNWLRYNIIDDEMAR